MFIAASHRAPLLALLQGLESGERLIVITGEPGVGKTALLQSVIPAGQGAGTHRVWCPSDRGEQLTLARIILDVAGKHPGIDPQEGANGVGLAQAGRTILIIDDAHLLTPEAAAYLVSVLDFGAGGPRKAGTGSLHVVLTGRPALWDVLRQAEIDDQVGVSGEVVALPPDEAREYLCSRLSASGILVSEVATRQIQTLIGRRSWTPAELNESLPRVSTIDVSGSLARSSLHGFGTGLARTRIVVATAVTAVILASGTMYLMRASSKTGRQGAAGPSPRKELAGAATYRATVSPDRLQPAVSVTDGQRRLSSAAPARPGEPTVSATANEVMQKFRATLSTAATVEPPPGPGPSAAIKTPSTDKVAASQPTSRDTAHPLVQPSGLALPASQIYEIVTRGETMLARGDIAAARSLYERAALANSAAAATIVGKTYDPIFLAKIGATAFKAEPPVAAKWYKRAVELGDAEGQDRLIRLQSMTRAGVTGD